MKRICKNGHHYLKTSTCPVCPHCEAKRKPSDEFMIVLSAPARRALENAGISSLTQLTSFSETELLNLHGFGKTSIPKLREVLANNGLQFRTD